MNQILLQSDQVFFQEIDDTGIAMEVSSGEYFKINSTGVHIWNCIDGVRSVSQIVEDLASEFSVPPAEIRQDVLAFLRRLQAMSMVMSLSDTATDQGS